MDDDGDDDCDDEDHNIRLLLLYFYTKSFFGWLAHAVSATYISYHYLLCKVYFQGRQIKAIFI